MKEKLIKYCHYYKGEKQSPFSDNLKSMFWEYEKMWINLTVAADGEKTISIYINEYIRDGLTNLGFNDGVPVTLKALLYNRFCHWAQGTPATFKKWYKSTYMSI